MLRNVGSVEICCTCLIIDGATEGFECLSSFWKLTSDGKIWKPKIEPEPVPLFYEICIDIHYKPLSI